jgi:DNA-binding SARP family transcriptional activator/predicted ATPase
MAALSLSLLGPFTATLNDQPLQNFKNRKVQALLIYLAVERDHPHRREALFTLLWPGMPEKSARHNLSQTLYALRQILTEQVDNQGNPTPLLLVDRQTVQLNPAGKMDVDINKLDQMLESSHQHSHQRLEDCLTCTQALETASSLYRGDFLSGFYLEDSNEFEAWAEAVRETYRHKLVELLGTLADIAIHAGDYDRAIRYINRQLLVDDLSERANRQKVEALALAGRRVEAMRQYHEFAQRLEDLLGTDPSPEITALYERIRSEDLSTGRREPTETEGIEPSTPRHNLMPQATPFIGRENELDQLDEILQDPNTRLVTITGPGGMGKTRLALACAERQLARKNGFETHPYRDGIFFVPLADVDDPDQIPKEIAATLGLVLDPGDSMDRRGQTVDSKQQIIGFLGPQKSLLVLDNFEQLAAGSGILSELLPAAPSLHILVTSRQRLNLLGEHVFPIRGLSFPTDEDRRDYGDYTAIQLFIQSAQRVRPDFELKKADQIHLTLICQLMDGLPLGLELAANWIDLVSVKEISAELQKSIDFLETDLLDLPERHRSLAAVCNSTWEYLNSQEQDHFARLSVFRGSFTREMAQQITGISLRILGTLVKKSLLQFDSAADRYRFHPYLRRFAAGKLTERPEDEFKVRDTHSDYFCAELATNQKIFESGLPHIACDRIEMEYANIKAAWDWAILLQNLESLILGLDGLCLHFTWRLQPLEGLKTCQEVDEKLTSLYSSINNHMMINRQLLEFIHAKVMCWEGMFKYGLDLQQTRRLYEKSMQILTGLENAGYDVQKEKAINLYFQSLDIYRKDLQKAKSLVLDSLALLEESDNHWWLLECLISLGFINATLGFYEEAIFWLEKGHAIAKNNQMIVNECQILEGLGIVSRISGKYEAAIYFYDEALSLAKSYQIHALVSNTLRRIGDLMLFLGRLVESEKYLLRGIKFGEERLDIPITIMARSSLGIVYMLASELQKAETIILKAVDLAYRITSTVFLYPYICQIELLAITGRYCDAVEKENRFAKWSKNIVISQWPPMSGRVSRALGWVALIEKNYDKAVKYILSSVEYFHHDLESIAWSQPYLALAYYRLGNRDKARELLNEALSYEIQMQAYIPMVFTLPVTLLLLVEENLEFSKKIYAQVRRDRFMSNAQLFHDLVYKHMPIELTEINVETIEHSDEHREALWETAKLVHAYLTNG